MNAAALSYLADKIAAAELVAEPFAHLYLENFLSDEHLQLLTADRQIRRPAASTTSALIDDLRSSGWHLHPFPGCTSSVDDYLNFHANDDWPTATQKTEIGRGLVFRLSPESPEIAALLEYLNGRSFQAALEAKFGIHRDNRIETAIQKYLTGYEISPHPDTRSKSLTYLVNINTSPACEALDIHTHLLTLNADKRFIYDYWRDHPELDRDHLPWGWCETRTRIRKNNTLVMFAPSNHSLHAVKLRYDHLAFQRTQIYGNLWYTDVDDVPLAPYTWFEKDPSC